MYAAQSMPLRAYTHIRIQTLDGSVEATRSHVDVTVSERAVTSQALGYTEP
jgi:hypothetical protein